MVPEREAGRGDEELHRVPEPAREPAHHVEGPADRLTAADVVDRHPRRDAVHGRVGVDGEADLDVRIHRLVHPSEGEAHLRQSLVLDPLRGDGLDLHLDPAGLLDERPEPQLDAELGGLVESGPHVLPGLAGVGQRRQVDHRLLRHLQALPAESRGVPRRLAGHGEQARHQTGGADGVGEGPQQPGAVHLVGGHGVAQPDGHAGVHPVGHVAASGADEPPVLRPSRHPGQPVDRALLAQQRGGRLPFVVPGGRDDVARGPTGAAR